MNRLLESLRRPATALIGVVFLVSGMFKLLDPTGTALIVSEYFKFLHLNFLVGFSRAFGFALSLAESLTGAALIAGVWRKWAILLAGLMTAFFTVITAVLLIVNPEMDCGCFGQMVHLTHLQSFLKNVVLMLLWALAAFPLCEIGAPRASKYVSFSLVAAAIVWFAIYSSRSLPMVDKTDLVAGVELSESDDDAPLLSIRDFDGNYCEDILQDGPVLVISIYDPAGASGSAPKGTGNAEAGAVPAGAGSRDEHSRSAGAGSRGVAGDMARFNTASALQLIAQCEQLGIAPVVLCTGDSTVPGIPDDYLFFADRRSLLSLNRSNAGATYLYDGQIVSKWMARDYPAADRLEALLDEDPIELIDSEMRHGHLVFQSVLLALFAVLLFV